jgi:nucleotide-binding universal stress UspA family protein
VAGAKRFSRGLNRFASETMRVQSEALADEEERRVRAGIEALAEEFGLPPGPAAPPAAGGAPDGPDVAFVEEAGRMSEIVQHNGRLADLVVVSQPDRDRNIGTNTLKSALFRTGRPVLMCPRGTEPADDLGRRVAVAWDGSIEAARAVALTLELVGEAGTVTLLAGGPGERHGATVDELVEYYALRGIGSEVRRFEERNPGAALVDHAEAAGANLLIMGAYGESHEREALFGGNTQAIVDGARVPVVMVH